MINVSITGGESTAAGELIRVLINHPDVNLIAVCSAVNGGNHVKDVHSGLEGDISMLFSHNLSKDVLERTDVVFLCGEKWDAESFMNDIGDDDLRRGQDNEVRIIDLTGAFHGKDDMGFVYGFAESNRKALVRGATRCSLPSAGAMAIEPALFPLIKNSLLRGDVKVILEMASPENHVRNTQSLSSTAEMSTRFDPVALGEYRTDSEAISTEVLHWIKSCDPDYSGEIHVGLNRMERGRGTRAVLTVQTDVDAAHMERLAEDVFSDHSFTYVVGHSASLAEVVNTNKCLLSFADSTSMETMPLSTESNIASEILPAGTLQVTSVTDHLLKGGAGNAVHCMNLLFGLSERTGLALKASVF